MFRLRNRKKKPYLIGERGPETIVVNVSGAIISERDIADAIRRRFEGGEGANA